MPSMKISELSEENFVMIETMAGTGFPPEEIAVVLLMDPVDFVNEYKNKGTIYNRYQKGMMLAQLTLRQRIFKDAGFGSSPAQTLAYKILSECDFKIKSYE